MCATLGDTHHFVLADPFCGLDGPVQAGLADVHVLGVGIAGQEPQQRPEVDVVVIIHVAEPSEGGGRGLCTEAPPPPVWVGASTSFSPGSLTGEVTYFRPDSRNLSYSTDILQHSAWRVRTAEQLVLIMRPPARDIREYT